MAWENTSTVTTGELITAVQWNRNRSNQEWLARDHWRAEMTADTSQSIPNNTLTVVNFSTVLYDFGSLASTVSDDFTIPTFPSGITTALIAVSAHTSWAANDTGDRLTAIQRQSGGSDIIASTRQRGASSSDATVYWEGEAVAGETFDLAVLQDSGGALNLLGSNATGRENPPLFTIRWLAWQD